MTTESLQAVSHAPSRFRADVWHSKGRPSGPLLSQAAFGAFSLLGQDAQPELRNSNKITVTARRVQRIFNLPG